MSKVKIHKNELAKYFIKDYKYGAIKIGKEKLNRWIDIPEYIELESIETKNGISDSSHSYQLGYLKGLNDAKDELNKMQSQLDNYRFTLEQKYNRVRIVKNNNILEVEDIADTPEGLFITLKAE